ncbi:MAG: hypothetical protein IJB10_02585 [Clostridia bacterium]|nr:hypothetical protein [Clostridia bacterium]
MQNAKKYTKKRITIDKFVPNIDKNTNEFEIKPNVAKNCYNFKVSEGALKTGNGFEKLTLPDTKEENSTVKEFLEIPGVSFKKIWRYKYYSDFNKDYEYILIAFGSDNKIYFVDMFGYGPIIIPINQFNFSSMPTALSFRVNGKDVMGFCSPTDNFTVWYCDDEPYQVEDIPKFSSICLHNERLFAIDSTNNYLVRYSSNLNPLNWKASVTTTSGGTIEVNDYKGMLKNLVSFLDNVFVFRDFGVSKISGYGANSMFSAVNIYNSSCKVFCNTACICGNNIYFLQEDGLYKLDGYNVQKVDDSFSHMFVGRSQEYANTCFYNGKLYIACNLNFFDDISMGTESNTQKNNALIEFDITTNSYNILRGVDVLCMLAVKDLTISKLIACVNGQNGCYMWQLTQDGCFDKTPLPKNWTGGKINFGTMDKNKILKEVNLICKNNCNLTVKTDEQTKIYNIKPKESFQKVRLNIKGKYFSFSFSSNQKDVFIANPQFVFNVED